MLNDVTTGYTTTFHTITTNMYDDPANINVTYLIPDFGILSLVK
jgi:hypothetical protein